MFWATLVSLIVGALLAYASELLADVIERSVGGRVRTSEPSAVTA